MILDRNSRLVRFGYLLNPPVYRWTPEGRYTKQTRVPLQTSLCAFFWRTFVFMPILCLSLLFITVEGVITVIRFWQFFLLGCAIAGVTLGSVFLIVQAAQRQLMSKVLTPVGESFDRGVDRIIFSSGWKAFWGGVWAIKGKICPIIQLKDREG